MDMERRAGPDLPSGTVTYLLTDVQSYSALAERAPASVRSLMEQLVAIVREAAALSGGHVIKDRGEGDSAFLVFDRASDAVGAARVIQTTVGAHDWPQGAELLLRIAVHTGEADLVEDDYYGAAVNRCARLRELAHGGQTLVSQATASLTRGRMPPECSLVSLGVHTLRDLGEPEHVYQLEYPELTSTFSPLRSVGWMPNNLPLALTSLVGRERDLAVLPGLMHTRRLLTLTGSGGTGKSRLALHAAAQALDGFPDGVWFVDLEGLTTSSSLAGAVARCLDLSTEPGGFDVDSLATHLRDRRMLIMLDGCEHLLSAVRPLATGLLAGCPEVSIVATSREPINLPPEQLYEVGPLDLAEAEEASPAALRRASAVQLFVERASQRRPGFSLTEDNALEVNALCHRLEGHPLAIELVAARIRTMSTRQLLEGLDLQFADTASGSEAIPFRQRTLHATVKWSHSLLSGEEQAVLRRMAVFQANFSRQGAAAVCAADGITQNGVHDQLGHLIDKSLVRVVTFEPEPVYRLSEWVRAFGNAELSVADELATTRGRLAAYCQSEADSGDGGMQGEGQADAVRAFDQLHEDISAVLEWARDGASDGAGLALAASTWRYWYARGYLVTGRRWLETFLGRTESAGLAPIRAQALQGLGAILYQQGDLVAAKRVTEESLALHEQLDDERRVSQVLNNLGNIARAMGDFDNAVALQERSLIMKRRFGAPHDVANTLYNLGLAAVERGRYATAKANFEEALAVWSGLGDARRSASALQGLGIAARDTADLAEARGHFAASLALSRAVKDRRQEAVTLAHLADLDCLEGFFSEATEKAKAAMEVFVESGNRWGEATSTARLAAVALATGDLEAAGRLYLLSHRSYEELGLVVGAVHALTKLAVVARWEHRFARARQWLKESLTRVDAADQPNERALALICLGEIETAEGHTAEARAALAEGLERAFTLGAPLTAADAIDAVACAVSQDDPRLALRLGSSAATIRARCGAVPGTLQLAARARVQDRAAGLLDSEDAVAELEAGRHLDLAETYAQAMSSLRW